MNTQRKNGAVKKYKDATGANGLATLEELVEMLNADEKGYTPDEITEIADAIISGRETANSNTNDTSPKVGTNRKYEEWKVKPVIENIKKFRANNEPFDDSCFEKDAMFPIRTTSISPDKAELLNTQSENTLVRLYEA